MMPVTTSSSTGGNARRFLRNRDMMYAPAENEVPPNSRPHSTRTRPRFHLIMRARAHYLFAAPSVIGAAQDGECVRRLGRRLVGGPLGQLLFTNPMSVPVQEQEISAVFMKVRIG